MNYFKIAMLLFVVTFLVETSHASQVALTHAKQIEPIEFDIDDNLFIIHPDAIHIYNKYEVFLAPGEPRREEILTERRSVGCVVGFARIGTIYDKYHSDKKLTGEAYQKALTSFRNNPWLTEMIKKNFIISFKEIVQSNKLDINKLNSMLYLPFNETIMNKAIREGDAELIKILIELGIHINEPYMQETPLQRAINFRKLQIVKLLLLAGANIRYGSDSSKSAAYCAKNYPPLGELVSEIYFAREAEQRKLPHKIFMAKGVGNVKKLADEIIEYLLGKNHKVMSMSACRKALETQ